MECFRLCKVKQIGSPLAQFQDVGQTQLWAWKLFTHVSIFLCLCLPYPIRLAHLTLCIVEHNDRTPETVQRQHEAAVFIMHSETVAMGYKSFQDYYLNAVARTNSGIQ